VAERVVDALEVIEVEEQARDVVPSRCACARICFSRWLRSERFGRPVRMSCCASL
jgi:hypothetical protein